MGSCNKSGPRLLSAQPPVMFEWRGMRRATTSAITALALVSALLLGALVLGAFAWQGADTNLAPLVSLKVETDKPGSLFRTGAVGLSIEARELGTTNLNARHYRLVRLMRLLGPSLLRIGGNSVDLSWWTSSGELPPSWATNVVTPADLDALRGLLRATGWRVLLGVNLGHFEPARAADEARFAKAILGSELAGIEIGNEPDDFGGVKQGLRAPSYGIAEYLREAEAYSQSLGETGVVVYGPALSETRWLSRLGSSLSMYSMLTQHYYPTGGCPNSPAPSMLVAAPSAIGLLSPIVRQDEDEVLGVLKGVTLQAPRKWLIGETNVAACGDEPNAGPQLASALWALDWSLRAASAGIAGLSFHSQFGRCGSFGESPVCGVNGHAVRLGDLQAHPEYYGLLAARQLEGGKFVPISLTGPVSPPDLTAWATTDHNANLRIAIDNMATSGPAQPILIPAAGYTSATEYRLSGPSAEAESGITLGAAEVTSTARWLPKVALRQHRGAALRAVLSPASAVVIILHRRRQRH
jgi:hypothetical protein